MKSYFQQISFFIFLLIIILGFDSSANACSCSGNETVDKEFAKFSNVTVLKLQEIKENSPQEKTSDLEINTRYSLTVEKVFKGNLKTGELLTFKSNFACSWTFDKDDVGKEFLFYLDKRPQKEDAWIAGYCTRSGSVSSKASDILYLEKEKKMRGKTRLSGDLNKMLENPEKESRYSFFLLANKKVRIVGNGKDIELLTDENGAYEIYDLPPGKYKIYPEKISGFTSSVWKAEFEEVEIKGRNHTEEDFYYEIDNEVSGKVTDIYGKPLENVCLDLVPSRNEKAKNYSKSSCTGKSGQFEISAIPAGTYYLVINKDGEIRLYEPFKTFYYPNVKNKEEATEITVLENTLIKDLKITPPEIIETVTISGVLLYKNGQPVVDQNVNFISEKEIFRTFNGKAGSDDEEHTDKNGRFAFKIWKGQSGVLRSSIFSYVGEYKNCPEIDALVRQKGDLVQQIDTIDVNIDANESLNNVALKFPFSKCEEAKDEDEDNQN